MLWFAVEAIWYISVIGDYRRPITKKDAIIILIINVILILAIYNTL